MNRQHRALPADARGDECGRGAERLPAAAEININIRSADAASRLADAMAAAEEKIRAALAGDRMNYQGA
jgi:hypothetical protein